MNTVCIIIAVIFFVAAIVSGAFTPNTWKYTGISWGLLAVGILFFGIGLIYG